MEGISDKKVVIILGGSSFMGLTFLQQILENIEQFKKVYILNRGKNYWDNKSQDFISASEGVFEHIIQDRDDKKQFTSKMQQIIQSHQKIDAVIDFCAYNLKDIKGSVKSINEKVVQYIYISSDSVYEVCPPQEKNEQGQIEDTTQSLEIVLLNKKQAKKLIRQDSYGFRKLEVEQYLFQQLEETETLVLSLRLADVIGPYDDSCRFWKYVLWSQIAQAANNKEYFIQLNTKDHINQKLSFTFSKDVISVIMKQILSNQKIQGAFNIACAENMTLQNFVNVINPDKSLYAFLDNNSPYEQGQCSHYWCTKICQNAEGHARAFYPSVENGYICISKSQQHLNFIPTPLETCIKESVEFFVSIQNKNQFLNEQTKVLEEMPKQLRKYMFQNQQQFPTFNFSQTSTRFEKLVKKLDDSYRSSSSSSSSSSDSDS